MFTIDELFSKESEWASFHDMIAEIKNRKYTVVELRKIFDNLPENIKDQAQVHGISDSVVRDNAYVFLCKHLELIKEEHIKKC